jgi:hypothetical protein
MLVLSTRRAIVRSCQVVRASGCQCQSPQSRQSAKLFLQSLELGLPQPLTRARVFRGEGHTRWKEREWESPKSDEGTYTVVLFICMYFVLVSIPASPDTVEAEGWQMKQC